MVASLFSQVTTVAAPLVAAAPPQLPGVVILVLCVVAGIGTVLLLPSRREPAIRKVGGAVLLLAGLVLLALLIRFAAGQGAETASGQLGPYFWIFSAVALVGSLRVVTHPRPVYSALYFVLTVMASAGLFILLQAEFMAIALIIIYAGAILITYVFVIMLAAQTVASDRPLAAVVEYDAVSREPVVASAIGFTLAGVLLFIIFDRAPEAAAVATTVDGTAANLGRYLFTSQVVSLEVAGLILTLSMVGAIIIARRRVVGGLVTGEAPAAEQVTGPATPVDDNPHSIPVYGTDNPRAKAYPET